MNSSFLEYSYHERDHNILSEVFITENAEFQFGFMHLPAKFMSED